MQILIFIMDGLTSLINLIGSIRGFKNPDNPPLIVEKVIVLSDPKPKPKRNTNYSNQSKSSLTDDSEFLVMLIVVFAVLGFAVWFNRKYHNVLVITASVLSLAMTILYIWQGTKYTLPTNKQVENWLFFSQPLLFSFAILLFQKSFDFAAAEKAFANSEGLSDTVSTMLSGVLNNGMVPFGLYHTFSGTFYIFFSIGLLFFIARILTRLIKRDVKILYRIAFSWVSTLFIYWMPLFVVLTTAFFAFYYSVQQAQ